MTQFIKYHIKWVKTSWTYSNIYICLAHLFYSEATLEIPGGNQAVPKVIIWIGPDIRSRMVSELHIKFGIRWVGWICSTVIRLSKTLPSLFKLSFLARYQATENGQISGHIKGQIPGHGQGVDIRLQTMARYPATDNGHISSNKQWPEIRPWTRVRYPTMD